MKEVKLPAGSLLTEEGDLRRMLDVLPTLWPRVEQAITDRAPERPTASDGP